MLLVKTKLEESKIPNAGIGCFAAEFIEAGTKIWEFSPEIDRVYKQNDLNNLSLLELEFLDKYSYRNNNLYYLCVDNGRFINHSNNPNTKEDNKIQATYASVDINIGEEIVSNYCDFGVNSGDYLHNCEGLFILSDFDIPYSC
jgi:SET domain-containing protein